MHQICIWYQIFSSRLREFLQLFFQKKKFLVYFIYLIIQLQSSALDDRVPLRVLHHDRPRDELQLLPLIRHALQEEVEAIVDIGSGSGRGCGSGAENVI